MGIAKPPVKVKIGNGNTRSKPRKTSTDSDKTVQSIAEEVASIKTEIQAARAKVKDIIKIKNASDVPVSLQQAPNENFSVNLYSYCKTMCHLQKMSAIDR